MDESLSESHLEAIRDGKDRSAGSMKALFTTHWCPLLLVFLVTAGGTVAFYTYVLLTYLPQTTSWFTAFALTAVGYVILTGYTSVNAIVKAELFPADIRALGVGLGYALANSAFGGTAPVLYQAAKPDHITLFIVYVTAVIGVSLLVYVFALKNKGVTVLDREQGSAWAVPAR